MTTSLKNSISSPFLFSSLLFSSSSLLLLLSSLRLVSHRLVSRRLVSFHLTTPLSSTLRSSPLLTSSRILFFLTYSLSSVISVRFSAIHSRPCLLVSHASSVFSPFKTSSLTYSSLLSSVLTALRFSRFLRHQCAQHRAVRAGSDLILLTPILLHPAALTVRPQKHCVALRYSSGAGAISMRYASLCRLTNSRYSRQVNDRGRDF